MTLKRVHGVYVVSAGKTEQPFLTRSLDEAFKQIIK